MYVRTMNSTKFAFQYRGFRQDFHSISLQGPSYIVC